MSRVTLSHIRSRAMYVVCCLCAAALLVALVSVIWFVASQGLGAISVSFFTKDFIAEGLPGFPGGMRHGLIGTGVLLAIASAVGVPIGILAGIFLSEYAADSRLAAPVRFVADVLTGVPSIVVGILGYELLVVPFAEGRLLGMRFGFLEHLFGISSFNAYAGALALAFIMIPIVARTTEEMLKLVPSSYREASIALGATKSSAILRVVVPAAMGPTITGVMLAIARVAGETAPLLFTAGAAAAYNGTRTAFPSLTVQIYDHIHGTAPQRQLAWAGVLVLVTVIFGVNLTVRFVTRRARA
jgi:phosphate transport system permease protein